MTSLNRPHWSRPRVHGARARLWRRVFPWVVCLVIGIAVAVTGMKVAGGSASRPGSSSAGTSSSEPAVPWPAQGQAALSVDGRMIGTSGSNRPVPIASLAKMMTAYVVLRQHPDLSSGTIAVVVSPAMMRDTSARRARGESIVPVRVGERLSERDALTALLLPSANNVAVALAARDAGTVPAFVAAMNDSARTLGMRSTHYTDPSGFDPGTVSTAADQLRLTAAVMRIPAFADIVRLAHAELPVAGRVHNTNFLLGHGGFVGTKTGSDIAAGGCFAFTQIRRTANRTIVVIGVVLGQRGGALIPAALVAAQRLTDAVNPG